MASTDQLHQVQVQKTWSPWGKLSAGGRAKLRKLWALLGLNHGTASILRYELDMILLRFGCWVSRKHRAHVADLAARRDLKVHLGCGNALLEGWVNLDCYPPTPKAGAEILTIDMRHGLPFADSSVDVLFSEHFLEHLPFEVVRDSVLPEIRRILQPGGYLRLSIPNGQFFVEQYVRAQNGQAEAIYEANRDGKSPMTMLNEIAHGYGHHFLYDFETLAALLESLGFTAIRKAAFGDSQCPELSDKDRNEAWRIAMSLYVEARVPSN